MVIGIAFDLLLEEGGRRGKGKGRTDLTESVLLKTGAFAEDVCTWFVWLVGHAARLLTA